MGKCQILFAVFAAAVALLVYRCMTAVDDVQPETMADDVWWGPANTVTTDDDAVRPFRIDVSAAVSMPKISKTLSRFFLFL